tara:strand:+ start:1041 stop:2849 length:1809 start_codon:yes stop_codon:yes gene_type:complete
MSTYSEIIQLSQIDPLSSVANTGDYSLTVQNNVTVNKGDNIIMKNAFLDTSAFDTQQIVLDEDLTLEFDFIGYIMHNKTFDGAIAAREADEGWGGVLGKTGLPLMSCKKVLADPNKLVCNAITFFKNLDGSFAPWGGITTTIKYTDWDGQTQHTHVKIPRFTGADFDITYKKSGFSFHFLKGEIEDVTPASLVKFGNYQPNNNNYLSGQTIFASMIPVVDTRTMTLGKGVYQPPEIAAVISEKAQSARSPSSTFQFPLNESLNAPFLSPLDQQTVNNSMCVLAPATWSFQGSLVQYPIDIQFAGTTGYWKGASQVALEYDDAQNKFFWSFLHTPSYGAIASETTSISVSTEVSDANDAIAPYEITSTSGNAPFYLQSGGGIMFSSLRARNSKGDLVDFWNAKMGFDLADLCFQNIYKTFQFFGTNTFNYPDITNFITQQTITLPEIIADMGVIKGPNFQNSGSLPPSEPQNTDKIYANKQVLEASLSTGFYFIDVIAEFQNSISNSINSFKHTVGIVSNFYNQNSFVTGTSADSLIYTHNSDQPLVLSSFNVRILDSSRSQPENLGDNNHIFLEIVHNPTPAELILQQEEAQEQIKQQLKKK